MSYEIAIFAIGLWIGILIGKIIRRNPGCGQDCNQGRKCNCK